jgi:hypothetical protein
MVGVRGVPRNPPADCPRPPFGGYLDRNFRNSSGRGVYPPLSQLPRLAQRPRAAISRRNAFSPVEAESRFTPCATLDIMNADLRRVCGYMLANGGWPLTMLTCIHCGRQMSRCRRGPLLKLFSRACYQCDRCGSRANFYRPIVTAFQRWAACPLYCNRKLALRRSVDPVERVSSNILRRLLFEFPIYHCKFCRYQFRDWRGLDPRTNPDDG